MQAKYNGHTLPTGRFSISRRETANETENGLVYSKTVQIEVSGHLLAESQRQMEAAYVALSDAYSAWNKDFLVFLDDGSRSHRLSLTASDSIGGLRVLEFPSLDTLANAAYTTWAPFRIVLEAEYAADDAAQILRSFKERLSFTGGGTVYGWLRPLRGRPQRQLLRDWDTFKVVQSGTAVGYLARPNPPGPIWPSMTNKARDLDLDSPDRRGVGSFVDYSVSWRYEMESDRPLFGSPNAWL